MLVKHNLCPVPDGVFDALDDTLGLFLLRSQVRENDCRSSCASTGDGGFGAESRGSAGAVSNTEAKRGELALVILKLIPVQIKPSYAHHDDFAGSIGFNKPFCDFGGHCVYKEVGDQKTCFFESGGGRLRMNWQTLSIERLETCPNRVQFNRIGYVVTCLVLVGL